MVYYNEAYSENFECVLVLQKKRRREIPPQQ